MNILAVGAHWDDIEIGCFCTLSELNRRGHRIFCTVVCTAEYQPNRNQELSEDDVRRTNDYEGLSEQAAREAGERAFAMFGGTYCHTEKAVNSQLVYHQSIMQAFERIAHENRIDTVFTHWQGDVNTDHRTTWEISRTAFRRVKNLFMYQSNSYCDGLVHFEPRVYFGFGAETYEGKRKALEQYKTEWGLRQNRWEREIFEREKAWGYHAGADYAEAFQIARIIDFYPETRRT
jgi:LmbE family N-acetylglucosaminyl deacetylase